MTDIKKGDIFYADLGDTIGSEQKGMRPVVIIQNNIGNKFSPTVIVAAITSSMRKTSLPVHIEISAQESNLPFESIILLEQVRTLDKSRLKYKISSLRPEFIKLIDDALKVSLELN
ncbi:MAG: type II toxin-antitoxin system PemK/MazF family toxin [Romboutsia sp.]|nr:type II toxin-antitoxin system PemK/MazF family toxin [Romboutsia sp.]